MILPPACRDLCRLMLNWRRLLTMMSVRPGVRNAPENVVRAVMTTYGLLSVVSVRVWWWVVSPTLLASRTIGMRCAPVLDRVRVVLLRPLSCVLSRPMGRPMVVCFPVLLLLVVDLVVPTRLVGLPGDRVLWDGLLFALMSLTV